MAGVIASSSWMPWVKIPGIVVAIAGGASMVVQLVKWYQCTDFRKFVDGIINKGPEALKAALFSGEGLQMIIITGLTTTTAIICYKSATGIAIRAAVISAWNKIADFLLNAVPVLKTTKINGIIIAPIK